MVAAPRAVLLDIDGTMVHTDGAGRSALARATAQELGLDEAHAGQELNAVDFRGATDRLILEEYGRRLGHELLEHPSLMTTYFAELDKELGPGRVKLMPGVSDLIAELEGRPQVWCGLLTGNVREAARLKLRQVGLDRLVDEPGGFGDDGHRREDLVEVALERLAAVGVKPWRTLIVGDTPLDVQAAHRWGVPAVAVATGWTDPAELRACEPELFLEDLRDLGPVFDLLVAL